MADSRDDHHSDSGDEQTHPGDEPYPWRDTPKEDTSDSGAGNHHTQREQVSNAPPERPPSQQFVSEDDSSEHYSTTDNDNADESQKPLRVRALVLLIELLSNVWHRKVLGIHWLVPRITGTTDPHEGLSGRFYPEDEIRSDEEVIYSGNPSRWLEPAPYVFAALFGLLGVAILILVPLGYGEAILKSVVPATFDPSVPERWWIVPLLLFAVAILMLVKAVLDRGSTWHIVTNKRILYRYNILSQEIKRIDLADVKGIDCRQPIPERWYNVGFIEVSTASTGDVELVIDGVKYPSKVSQLIDEARYKHRNYSQSGSYQTEPYAGEHPQQHMHVNQPQQPHRNPHPERQPGSPSRQRGHGPQHGGGNQGPSHHHRTSADGRYSQPSPERTGGHESPPRQPNHRGSGSHRTHTNHTQGSQNTADQNPHSNRAGDSIEEHQIDHSLREDLDKL